MKFRASWMVGIPLACSLAVSAGGETVDGELGKLLDRHLTHRASEGFSGVVLVAKDDRVLLSKGYGLADRKSGAANSPQTVFPIGSITKQFTAAAILKLEAQGRLRVEDLISQHFEGVPADKTAITLHHLLTHSSGLPEAIGHDDEKVLREDFVKRALAAPLSFEPGARYLYSNVGYSLLAAIVEQTTGESYESYLQRELFQPAGMTRTGYLVDPSRRLELARGYRGDRDWGTPLDHPRAEDGPYWNLRGNGGMLSTVGDMHRWIEALKGDAVLEAAQRRKLFTPYVAEGPGADTHYGYGWVIGETSRGHRLITHNGGNGFFTNDLLWLPDDGLFIYLASNDFTVRAFELTGPVARIALGISPAPSQRARRSGGEAGGEWGLPDSPTGKLASALLSALADGGGEAARRFLKERAAPGFSMSEERFVELVARFHGDLGEFEVSGARKKDDASAMVAVRSLSGPLYAELDLRIEPDPPHRLVSLGVRVEAGDRLDVGGGSLDSFEDADRKFSQRADEGLFSGVVLAGRLEGEPVLQKAYGLADKRFGSPNRVDTKFNLGSINKVFTSVAVLQLAEAGKLNLDDTLGRHLDGFPPEIAEKVTVRHLLRHESGWGAYWDNPEYLANLSRLRSVSQLLEFIRKIPLDFEPGTRRSYSNVGFEVLGAIVEKVSGMDYYDYVREHVYAPAGMTDTDSFYRDGPARNLATGYTNDNPAGSREGFEWENTLLFPPRGTPAGGGYSTARDLLSFARALAGDRLLGRDFTDLLFDQFEEGRTVDRSDVAVGWGGGAPGVNAALEMDFGAGWIVVVLCNIDPPAAEEAARELMSLAARSDG